MSLISSSGYTAEGNIARFSFSTRLISDVATVVALCILKSASTCILIPLALQKVFTLLYSLVLGFRDPKTTTLTTQVGMSKPSSLPRSLVHSLILAIVLRPLTLPKLCLTAIRMACASSYYSLTSAFDNLSPPTSYIVTYCSLTCAVVILIPAVALY